jgi:hypothetical protein
MTNNDTTLWALYDGDPYENVSNPVSGRESCAAWMMGIYDCHTKAEEAAKAHGLGIANDYYVIPVTLNKYEV